MTNAAKHIHNILKHAIQFTPDQTALVIYDNDAPLTRIVVEGYRANLPAESFLDFATTTAEEILARFESMKPGDLVVLVQSTNFRLNEFRLRIELFKLGLKTIEHIHLSRIDESQFDTYIESLAYDPSYYRPRGKELKRRIDTCTGVIVECPGTTLVYDSSFEPAKLNTGDYAEMKNVGGTYPIGEVFSEPSDLTKVNGEVRIFAYAGKDHKIREVPAFTAIVRDGILAMIEDDSPVHVREFGLGLNRAMGKGKLVNDLTAFERMCGMHMSLGAKHSIYKKPGMPRDAGRYHVDVFIDLSRILIDNKVIYENGDFVV
jgi:aminopeptidase